jgi:general secretion pathway protein G
MEETSAALSPETLHGSLPEPGNAPRGEGGFTVIELVITVLIVGILSTIAIPNYLRYLEKNKETTAISDIITIAGKLKEIIAENPDALPASLAQINFGATLPLIDPWGHPYQYLRLYGLTVKEAKDAGARKRKNLNPINTDFDLYSMGPDGETQENLKSSKGKDDIVRGDDGAYVGVANGFEP